MINVTTKGLDVSKHVMLMF